MHPDDAVKVGNKLANAAIIAATFGFLLAIAILSAALPWERLLP